MKKMTLSLLALGLAATLPAQAVTVTAPAGANHELRFDWNTDVENHLLIVGPRAQAVIDGTERIARKGLANAQRRQADVRGALMRGGAAAQGGVWVRVGGAFGQQDGMDLSIGELASPISGLGPNPITTSEELVDYTVAQIEARLDPAYVTDGALANLSYDEQISHFNVGADFVSGNRNDGAWIVGGAIGYVRASQEFDDFSALDQASKFDWDSVNLGAYTSYVKGAWYVDAALNYAWHSIDLDMPILGMIPDGSMITSDAQSLAVSLEGGWRFDLGNNRYVEPQASLVWIKSDLEDTKIQRADALTHNGQFNTLNYGDPESRRAGLGAEVGQSWDVSGLTLTASLNARYWQELEDERTVTLSTPATLVNTTTNAQSDAEVTSPALIAKQDSGYTQITLGGYLRNGDSSLSGGLNLDYFTGGDFDSYGVTASLRYQW